MSIFNSIFNDTFVILNYVKGMTWPEVLSIYASAKVLLAGWKAKLAADADKAEILAKAEAAKLEIELKSYWSYLWTEIKNIF